MRQFVALAALILMAPPVAHAQARQGGNHRPPPPPTAPARPTVPPPPITYPFAPLMPPPAGGLTPRFGEGTPFRTHTPLFFPSGSTAYAPFVFGYQDSVAPDDSRRRTQSSLPAPSTGLLRLSLTPVTAQVFIDGYYVGTVEDIEAQRVLQLEAGPHRIEVRAPQYHTLTVDIRVLPHETVTYRGALEPTRPQAATPPPPAAGPPTVMYVIPKCYVGNLPPRQSRLPSGCDVKQVQILKPPVIAAR
jgi:hypothetical protein